MRLPLRRVSAARSSKSISPVTPSQIHVPIWAASTPAGAGDRWTAARHARSRRRPISWLAAEQAGHSLWRLPPGMRPSRPGFASGRTPRDRDVHRGTSRVTAACCAQVPPGNCGRVAGQGVDLARIGRRSGCPRYRGHAGIEVHPRVELDGGMGKPLKSLRAARHLEERVGLSDPSDSPDSSNRTRRMRLRSERDRRQAPLARSHPGCVRN